MSNRKRREKFPHVSLSNRVVRCLCGKLYSPTKEDAKALRKEIAEERHHVNQVRFYQCEHSGFHWTSQVNYEDL